MSGTAADSGDPSGSPPEAPSARRRSLEVAALVVAVAGVLVAILAWRLPPDADRPGAGSSTGGTVGTSAATSASTTSGSATPSTEQRYLTELTPASGGGNVQRVGGHSLFMRCATGESDDRDRAVTYDLPRAGYTALRTSVRPTGARDTRVEVRLLVDDVVRVDQVVAAGGAGTLSADVAGGGQVTLRIICDPGAASATFGDPALHR